MCSVIIYWFSVKRDKAVPFLFARSLCVAWHLSYWHKDAKRRMIERTQRCGAFSFSEVVGMWWDLKYTAAGAIAFILINSIKTISVSLRGAMSPVVAQSHCIVCMRLGFFIFVVFFVSALCFPALVFIFRYSYSFDSCNYLGTDYPFRCCALHVLKMRMQSTNWKTNTLLARQFPTKKIHLHNAHDICKFLWIRCLRLNEMARKRKSTHARCPIKKHAPLATLSTASPKSQSVIIH